MLNQLKSRKRTEPEVRIVHRTVYRDIPENVQMRERHENYIELAKSEYARLSADVKEELDFRDAGKQYSEDRVSRHLGQMTAIADSVALLTGEDRIIVGAQLESQARERLTAGEEFPFNSFLGGLSLTFRSKVEEGIRNDLR